MSEADQPISDEEGRLLEWLQKAAQIFNEVIYAIEAAEREACAKVAESYEPQCESCPRGVANAIRARGPK